MKILANQIEWHDAKIIEVLFSSTVDRIDRITIKLISDAFIHRFGTSEISVVISDCYKIRTDFNLWTMGSDSIFTATIQDKSTWIDDVIKRYTKPFIPDQITQHFTIISNSGSQIEALFTHEDCLEVFT